MTADTSEHWALHYADRTKVIMSSLPLDELWKEYDDQGLLDITPYDPSLPDADDANLVRGDHDADP